MERGVNSHLWLRVPLLRLGVIGMIASLATASAAQDDVSGAEELDFSEAFAPFDRKPPLYEPGDDDHAVDLTQIDPPRGRRVVEDLGTGTASFYGKRFHGRRTASGEAFDMHAHTAAHRTLPFGTLVRVTNPRNGKFVVVRINDRGPFSRGRVIDLSRAAAEELGMINRGHALVELALVEP